MIHDIKKYCSENNLDLTTFRLRLSDYYDNVENLKEFDDEIFKTSKMVSSRSGEKIVNEQDDDFVEIDPFLTELIQSQKEKIKISDLIVQKTHETILENLNVRSKEFSNKVKDYRLDRLEILENFISDLNLELRLDDVTLDSISIDLTQF
jgi:hypothetical protein